MIWKSKPGFYKIASIAFGIAITYFALNTIILNKAENTDQITINQQINLEE